MTKSNLTYAKSGVNIKAADKFVKFISSFSKNSSKKNVFKNIGAFGSITKIPSIYKNPHLVASTDGVGTKIEIANILNNFKTIGIDLVAMCVNDLIVQGAKPIIFLDYISVHKINLKKLKNIIKGIQKGCKISQCELVGGETAEMPGTYNKNKFDLAGFSVGIVSKNKILDSNKVKQGNLILAIPSNGIHSNGFSLIRNIIKKKGIDIKKNSFLKKEFLKPTKIYVKEILSLIKKNKVNGCVHITGGGLKDNIERIIPNKLTASINLNQIKTKKIFNWINQQGVKDNEMLKTFNCGVGFCIIINKKNLKIISKAFSKQFKPYVIGQIDKGNEKIRLIGKLNWKKR